MKTQFSNVVMPNRILSYEKIMKGREQNQMKTQFSNVVMPNRILSYEKRMKSYPPISGNRPSSISGVCICNLVTPNLRPYRVQ